MNNAESVHEKRQNLSEETMEAKENYKKTRESYQRGNAFTNIINVPNKLKDEDESKK